MMSLINNQKSSKGFTLIELMIVVAIIGILAAIAIPQFSEYRKKAFNGAAQADLRNMMTAEEASFAENYVYTPVAANTSTFAPARLASLPSVGNSKGVGYVIISSPTSEYAAYTGHMSGDFAYAGDSSGFMGKQNAGVPASTTAIAETAQTVSAAGGYTAL